MNSSPSGKLQKSKSFFAKLLSSTAAPSDTVCVSGSPRQSELSVAVLDNPPRSFSPSPARSPSSCRQDNCLKPVAKEGLCFEHFLVFRKETRKCDFEKLERDVRQDEKLFTDQA